MSQDTKLPSMFLNEKPVRVMRFLYENESYASKISEDIDSTYAHTVKIIAQLREFDVVNTEQNGRKKLLTLTDKGEKIAERMDELFECFGENYTETENKERTSSKLKEASAFQ